VHLISLADQCLGARKRPSARYRSACRFHPLLVARACKVAESPELPMALWLSLAMNTSALG
jgi:hypothetical protein